MLLVSGDNWCDSHGDAAEYLAKGKEEEEHYHGGSIQTSRIWSSSLGEDVLYLVAGTALEIYALLCCRRRSNAN